MVRKKIHLQERFRPKTWEDLKGLENKSNGTMTDKEILKRLAITGWCTSIFFVGPPGTGKTSAARLFAATYFGIPYDELDDYEYFLQINASGARGIDVIRGDVQTFFEMGTENDKARIIIFDEADGLTFQAQEALKAIVEIYAHLTISLFCLNKEKRMDEALYSRAKIFYCSSASRTERLEWLIEKTTSVGLIATKSILETVVDYYDGDLRRTISDFIIPNQECTVTKWDPIPTFAEQIYYADDPSLEYRKLSKENYIKSENLIRDILKLNNYKNVVKIGDALLMIKKDPMIAVLYALTAIVKV